jgi:hypothetical protein
MACHFPHEREGGFVQRALKRCSRQKWLVKSTGQQQPDGLRLQPPSDNHIPDLQGVHNGRPAISLVVDFARASPILSEIEMRGSRNG